MQKNSYQEKLQSLANKYAHETYTLSKKLPKEELFGITSQLRRASLSVALNIIEGFARNSKKSYKNFLLISLGSLKESEYILNFCAEENLFQQKEIHEALQLSKELGRMLWGIIRKL